MTSYAELHEGARRNTRRLVLLLAAAIAAVVLELFLAVRLFSSTEPRTPSDDLETLLTVGAVTLGFVGLAALFKLAQLRGGGPAVAEMAGGRVIAAGTPEPAERTLRAVVDELAIASALPVPAVYVLDREPGLNAFAAGLTPQDAAVAVTRGMLRGLNREELKGVVAHEFAHIRNGDTRLNTRLIALQFGLLAVGVTGLGITLVASRVRTRRKEEAGIKLFLFVAGLVLAAVGFLGVLKARLIQAAVSRQREFLADASAVELTANPAGLVSALRKLGAAPTGSTLDTARAGEIGHLLFGSGRRATPFDLFSTHPPLEERIRRLEGGTA